MDELKGLMKIVKEYVDEEMAENWAMDCNS